MWWGGEEGHAWCASINHLLSVAVSVSSNCILEILGPVWCLVRGACKVMEREIRLLCERCSVLNC